MWEMNEKNNDVSAISIIIMRKVGINLNLKTQIVNI
jgi:hypothetical protein